MDKLSKLFPYSSPTELKVKSVVNYLTQDLDFDQLSKLENLTQLMIERKISKDEFSKLLSRDLKQGGVGISGGVAETMANKVLKILEQSEDTRRFRRRFEKIIAQGSESKGHGH